MILKNFFNRGARLKNDGEFVLWQADRGRKEEKEDCINSTVRMFNLPVSPKALAGHGKIFAVQSSVKGDGASTLAANLAGLLAVPNPEKVVLVDLDGYGAVRSRMGLPAGECLVNILDWEDIHGPGDVPGGLLSHSSGIMVVPGVIHYDHVEKVTPALVFKMLALLKESYDYIVLDCPPAGIDNNTWAAALVSDVILTVFRPDRTSLDMLSENHGFIQRLGCQDRTYMVFNQAGIPGGIRPADVENRLNLSIFIVLPYSIEVAEANNRRQLIVHSRQKDSYSRALQILADKISNLENEIKITGIDHELVKKLAERCGENLIGDSGAKKDQDSATLHISSKIPGLSEEKYREIRGYVQTTLSNILKPEERTRSRDPIVRSKLKSIVMRGLLEKDVPLGEAAARVLVEELGNDLLGYGPVEPFFYDPEVTEIKAGRDLVRVERQGVERVAGGVSFRSEDHIRDVLERMLAPTGRKIDMANPKVNARMIDGSRMIAHIPPVAVKGTMFTIRRFRKDMTVENLIIRRVISPEVMEFLKAAVISRQNMVISGGTSSGKTTVLNCLASFIPDDESIVTIEDPAELQLQHSNVRSLEARPATADTRIEITQRDLVVDALRMAPKRIIVGECRAGETFDMLQAMNTGHKGSLTTAHANSARHCTRRLVNMVQMAQMDIPYDGIVEQIADAVDIFIHVLKDRTGRRRVDHICEVAGAGRKDGVLNVSLNILWQYNPKTDSFEWVAGEFRRREMFAGEGGWLI